MRITDYTYKICLFGDGGVGKTSLTQRYLTGFFSDDIKATLGAAIHVKYLTIEGLNITLQIWDFGGEEQFKFLLPAYAHGSSAGIFMFDLTRYPSFKNIDAWLTTFRSELPEIEKKIPIWMIGGKMDLKDKRSITSEDALQISENNGLFDFMECSAKTGDNVDYIFEEITRQLLKKRKV